MDIKIICGVNRILIDTLKQQGDFERKVKGEPKYNVTYAGDDFSPNVLVNSDYDFNNVNERGTLFMMKIDEFFDNQKKIWV
jgi:hypothetical protein